MTTRIAGTDGVSLETMKWADVLEGMGFECDYITGQSDRRPERTALIEEAHFQHPRIADIGRRAYGSEQRSSHLTAEITQLARAICKRLKTAIMQSGIDVLVAESSPPTLIAKKWWSIITKLDGSTSPTTSWKKNCDPFSSTNRLPLRTGNCQLTFSRES